jgi:transposase
MGRATRKRYSSSFKFETVMETITGGQSDAEVARARGVHPVTLSHWKKEFYERGPEIFGGGDELRRLQEKVKEMHELLGRKEVELALAENFLRGRSQKR